MAATEAAPDWRPRFFTVWASQAVSIVGSSVAGFALVWWLTTTTGSATVLVVSALATTLPQVLLGPVAGALVDRLDRRLVMMAADAAVALVSAWLAYLFWSSQAQSWHVFVIMAARGLGGAFHFAAMQASTALMVPGRHLSRVAGLNQTVQASMAVLSPPLGALLLSVSSVANIMLLDVATAAIAVALLACVTIPRPLREDLTSPIAVRPTLLSDLRAGMRYVLEWRALGLLMASAALLNAVINPAMWLLPLLVTDHFGGGPGHLATVESAFSLGMVGGGLLLAAWGGFERRMLTVLVGLVLAGAFLLTVGLAPSQRFWLAVVGMAGFAFVNPLINGPIVAIMQATVDPAIQGRVMTFALSLAQGATPLGLMLSGPLADAIGVRPIYLAGAVICLACGLVGFLVPELFRFEEGRDLGPSRQQARELPPQ